MLVDHLAHSWDLITICTLYCELKMIDKQAFDLYILHINHSAFNIRYYKNGIKILSLVPTICDYIKIDHKILFSHIKQLQRIFFNLTYKYFYFTSNICYSCMTPQFCYY